MIVVAANARRGSVVRFDRRQPDKALYSRSSIAEVEAVRPTVRSARHPGQGEPGAGTESQGKPTHHDR